MTLRVQRPDEYETPVSKTSTTTPAKHPNEGELISGCQLRVGIQLRLGNYECAHRAIDDVQKELEGYSVNADESITSILTGLPKQRLVNWLNEQGIHTVGDLESADLGRLAQRKGFQRQWTGIIQEALGK